MKDSRVLAAVANVGLRHPRLSLTVAAVLLVVAGVVASGMRVSTSRYELVAADNPHQARLLKFFDRFGYPDALAMVVSGGDAASRQRVVTQLCKRLEQEPELRGRVLGRVGIEQVAELLMIIEPEVLKSLRRSLTEPNRVAEVIEGGLPRWIAATTDQITAGLEGEGAAAVGLREEQADEGLEALAILLRALDAQLAGEDALGELPRMASKELPRGVGLDDHGFLVSGDGSYHLVALFPKLAGPEVHQAQPVVERIRAVRDQVVQGEVQADLTGLPALVADELDVLTSGLLKASIATTLGVVLLLFLGFRSKRYALLALVPLLLGVVMTLAVARLGYGGLNLVTSSFAPVMLALGIAFAVPLLSRYGEYLRGGTKLDESVRGALVRAGPGVVIAAITTVLAFLTLTTTEFTAYGELGVLTAVGLLLMLIATLLLLPALFRVAGRAKTMALPELPGARAIPPAVRSARHAILVVALLLVVGSVLTFRKISFNSRYFDFLPESTESARALFRIERDSTVSPIQAGIGAESVEEARAVAERLRALPSVAAVQTATDVLPPLTDERLKRLREGFEGLERDPDFEVLRSRKRSIKEAHASVRDLADALDEVAFALRQAGRKTAAVEQAQAACRALQKRLAAMPDEAPSLDFIERGAADLLERAWRTGRNVAARGQYTPDDLPEVFRARFVSLDGQALAVYANPAGSIWDPATARQFAKEVTEVAPDVAGMAVNIYEHTRMIQEGFARATGFAALLVLVVLLAGFRRLGPVLLALVPVVIGFCWTLGLMGALGLEFTIANVVVLPLILGIGIDAGAHMVNRWRYSAAEGGGVGDLGAIVRGTGSAVLIASLTTAVGFAALMTGEYGPMRSIGLIMTIGIGCCLIASVLVLPALLYVLKKAR